MPDQITNSEAEDIAYLQDKVKWLIINKNSVNTIITDLKQQNSDQADRITFLESLLKVSSGTQTPQTTGMVITVKT